MRVHTAAKSTAQALFVHQRDLQGNSPDLGVRSDRELNWQWQPLARIIYARTPPRREWWQAQGRRT